MTLPKLILPFVLVATLPSALFAADEGTNLFKDAKYDDFYFSFIEDDDPKEVFVIGSDGSLIVKGKDHSEGYLQTLDEYANYELHFEWRWLDSKPGDSGVMIHCDADPYKSIWPHGIEIQIAEDTTGDLWLMGNKATVDDERIPEKSAERDRRKRIEGLDAGKEKKTGAWNEMRIVAKDDTLKVYLNDKLINEATELKPASGYITIKAEESNVEFRDFRIKEF